MGTTTSSERLDLASGSRLSATVQLQGSTTEPSSDPGTDPTPTAGPTTDPTSDPTSDPAGDPTTDSRSDPKMDPRSDAADRPATGTDATAEPSGTASNAATSRPQR